MKNDEPVFLAVVRTSDNFVPQGRKNKISPVYAAVNTAHGMIECEGCQQLCFATQAAAATSELLAVFC